MWVIAEMYGGVNREGGSLPQIKQAEVLPSVFIF